MAKGYAVYVQKNAHLLLDQMDHDQVEKQRSESEVDRQEYGKFDDMLRDFGQRTLSLAPGTQVVMEDLEGVNKGARFRFIRVGPDHDYVLVRDYERSPGQWGIDTPREAVVYLNGRYQGWRDAAPGRSLDTE